MAEALRGFFIARVGRLGSSTDPEPFALDADLGPLPARVVVSPWGHSAAQDNVPPVGSASVERVGNDLVARGELWTEIPSGADTAAMLARLGSRAKFSVAYRALGTRPGTAEERGRGVFRVLTRVQLLELSPVLVAAEQTTELLELKASRSEADAAWGELVRSRAWADLAARIRHRRFLEIWRQVA